MLSFRVGICVALCLSLAAQAHSAEPAIESVSQLILQRGSSSEVELVGAGLKECRELVFYSQGIRCTKVEPIDEYSLKVTIEVDNDCRIASHPFRLRNDEGFSNLRTLRVSRFVVVTEPARKQVDELIPIGQLPATLSGILEDGDYDRYSVSLAKGQRFTAEVEAIRLGGELLDTVLTVTDPNGNVIAMNDDGPLLHQDPAVSFLAESSGTYTIEVRESNYGGSSTAQYALHLGSFPASGIAYPAGGPAGQSLSVQILSVASATEAPVAQDMAAQDTATHNTALEHSATQNTETQNTTSNSSRTSLMGVQRVMLPEPGNDFQLFATDASGSSAAPIPFRVSPFPNIVEQEPNNEPRATASTMSRSAAPVAFNGIIQSERDIDYFAFEATQGEALQIEVFADRIGSPIDTFLLLLDSTGQMLVQNDDWGSQDSRLEWTAPQTGTYWLAIHDKLHRGASNGVYRIELTPLEPALTAFLPRPDRLSQRKQTLGVPQGNRVLARVGVLRENAEGSDITLRFTDLPNGVNASPVFVAPNEFWALAILEAGPEAPIAGALSRVVPSTTVAGKSLEGEFRQVVDLITETADRLYESAVVDRLAVAVTPALPFSIELAQPETTLPLGGTLDITIRLTRDAGFTAPVRVEWPFLPDGCVAEPFIVIEGDQSVGHFTISASPQTPVGDFKLAAVAHVSLADARISRVSGSNSSESSSENWFAFKDRDVSSQLVDLTIAASPVIGEFLPLAAEQGTTVKVQCKLTKAGPVPKQLHCELEELPNRITAPAIDIDSDESIVEFDLKVPGDAPLGSFSRIQCRLSGVLNDSKVSFVVPARSALEITEPGKLFRADDGRVLSPLEALREQNGK